MHRLASVAILVCGTAPVPAQQEEPREDDKQASREAELEKFVEAEKAAHAFAKKAKEALEEK